MNPNTTLPPRSKSAAEDSFLSTAGFAPIFVLSEVAHAEIMHDEHAAKEARRGGNPDLADSILAGISQKYPLL